LLTGRACKQVMDDVWPGKVAGTRLESGFSDISVTSGTGGLNARTGMHRISAIRMSEQGFKKGARLVSTLIHGQACGIRRSRL
jgi:hypothetical protein